MKLEGLNIELTPIPGAVPAYRAEVGAAQWTETCRVVAEQGGRLVSLWGSDARGAGRGFIAHAALVVRGGLVVLSLPLAGTSYPDVSAIFPAADRMQRAAFDLLGLSAIGSDDRRKWLRHAAWQGDEFPLRKDFVGGRRPHHEPSRDSNANDSAAPRVTGGRIPEQTTFGAPAPPLDAYPFVRVEGEGVHEIPVGPVHAGTIEPGHFRFSIVGETVLRLEQRLGYKHKGIEKRFEEMSITDGARLAGRVSGDSTVAYAWAYAMAVESAAGITPPPRALWLRAMLLERERVANHLGDLGFLGNDAALAFGLAQFLILKEEWLRTNQAAFCHRYLMDTIVPGGVSRDVALDTLSLMRREMDGLEKTVTRLKSIYDEHAGLQDRFINCGRVAPELAARLGLIGIAGRASGQSWDLRVEYPSVPYPELDVRMATHRNGDVAARVTVRFEEIFESLRLLRLIVDRLPLGALEAAVPAPQPGALGVGWVEGWRGEVFIALEAGADGRVRRCHAHDPSWQNWPLLEHAVIGNIVPDFPLINKSFNLSYSGQDL
ncbi:MAG: hydrogenase [Betaproteobacteria bacterium RIFCSPLOWO2_02_FULL_67_26]|nr:MAG: hydrogenase [Betaproteobacteria bacterium RIFCSPLOWO2_02_FULL_67_26]